jgi:hypothetical protein
MTPDEALLKAWLLGYGDDGWSAAVMAEAKQLLPILIAAGYAETNEATWDFTPKGAARAMELEKGAPEAGED